MPDEDVRVAMTTRRMVFLLSLVVVLVSVSPIGQTQTFDVLIRGGQILDGSGNPWFSGDIGITGDRIAAVGRLPGATATRVIDATGLVVSPGFIDMHAHSDTALVSDGLAHSKVRQGVTVEVLGEGTSVAPRDGLTDEPEPGGPTLDWTTFTGYFQRLTKQGVSVNVASYVSAAQVRRVVMGYTGRAATAAELERMKQLVARSMEEGAAGLVARFETGGPTDPDEIIALAKVAASHGGIYASHTGRQGSQQEKEYAFAIRVAQEAKIPVHIFHLKIIDESNWGTIEKFLNQVEAARARGLEVSANQYPYTAMSHGWSAFFPVWARESGPEKFGAMLQDPAVRDRIKKDPEFLLLSKEHGGWDGIAMARAFRPENQKYAGMRVRDIAKARGDKDPADTVTGADGRRKRPHYRRVPQSVGEGSAGRNEAAVDFRGKRWHCLDRGRSGRAPSAQLRNARACARPLRQRIERVDARGCRAQDDVAAGANSRPARSRPHPQRLCRRHCRLRQGDGG